MKNLVLAAAMIAGLFAFSVPAQAVLPLALDGSDYNVFMFCSDDAGDYCSKGDIKNDKFIFENDNFMIDSFDGGVLGVGGSGEFNENGLSFDATYEVVPEELDDKYTFDVQGFNIIDTVLVGSMAIEYYTWEVLSFGYEKEDEATAYFFAVKQ